MNATTSILQARDLTRSVDGHRIVDSFTFLFHSGGTYTVVGPSGAGKSSLLRLFNRLDEPTSGEIIFDEKPVRDYSPCSLRCKIGYLFQTAHLFPHTVRDNFLYAECALKDTDVERLMNLVHLDHDLLDRPVDKLSVGQKQRVALGRLLATNPAIALLDEPTSALDPSITEAIEDTIRDIAKETGLTVIMVTHHPDQALRMGGDTLLLVEGRLVESGPCEQVINEPTSEEGKRYRSRQLR